MKYLSMRQAFSIIIDAIKNIFQNLIAPLVYDIGRYCILTNGFGNSSCFFEVLDRFRMFAKPFKKPLEVKDNW